MHCFPPSISLALNRSVSLSSRIVHVLFSSSVSLSRSGSQFPSQSSTTFTPSLLYTSTTFLTSSRNVSSKIFGEKNVAPSLCTPIQILETSLSL